MKRTRETWKTTIAQRREMLARYRDGERPTALAREYGITRQTLMHHARKAGITPIHLDPEAPQPEDAWTGGWVRRGLVLVPATQTRNNDEQRSA